MGRSSFALVIVMSLGFGPKPYAPFSAVMTVCLIVLCLLILIPFFVPRGTLNLFVLTDLHSVSHPTRCDKTSALTEPESSLAAPAAVDAKLKPALLCNL